MSPSTSREASGRRYALSPRRATIVRAHGRSSVGVVGRQLNTLRRLGVSETPVGANGPRMITSRRCGSVVIALPPEPPPANDQSCGRIRSSYGPSNRRTNAADTTCWPALIGIGSVYIEIAPRPSAAPDGQRLVADERDALAVDRDVDVLEPGIVAAGERHLERVLGVGREHVLGHQPAARAERRAGARDPTGAATRSWCSCRCDRRPRRCDRRPPCG